MADPALAAERHAKKCILEARARKAEEVLRRPEFAGLWEPYPFNAGYFMCLKLKGLDAETYRKHLLEKYGVGVIADGDRDIRVAFSAVELDQLEDLYLVMASAARDLLSGNGAPSGDAESRIPSAIGGADGMQEKIKSQAITFDDVLLEPRYSSVLPTEVDVSTQLTRRIRLNIPILSSPMDTVTESAMAIALAQEGGIGVIHKNMSIKRQTDEVEKVKRSANGIIVNPATLPPDATAEQVSQLMDQYKVSGVPITDPDGRLVGIVTRRDLRFLANWDVKVSEVMTRDNLVTATGNVTLADAEQILMEKKVEKLLLVDENFRLTGLITIKDIDMMRSFPNACKDAQGRLRVGAAVGVHDYERVDRLIKKVWMYWWSTALTGTPST